jgi:SAM-dependent methyltransferase
VTFTLGDFLAVEVSGAPFNLVIGQGSFMHFADHSRLLRKCADLLKPRGWLAIEDFYVRRRPASEEEPDKLRQLFDCWNGRFHPRRCWAKWLRAAGLTRWREDDLSALAAQELCDLVRLAETGRLVAVTESELRGWRLAADLLAAGLIGTMRLLVRKLPNAWRDGRHGR